MNAAQKRDFEVAIVETLNRALSLNLTEIRSLEADPPDVVALLNGQLIGIEVVRPIEQGEVESMILVKRVITRRVEKFAEAAAPGQVLLSTDNIAIHHLDPKARTALARELAELVLRLSRAAQDPGTEATSAQGTMREVLEQQSREGRCNLLDENHKPPIGFAAVKYERLRVGGLRVIWTGGHLGPFWGPGLETTAQCIDEKNRDLARWPSFHERWLVVAAAGTRTSVDQVRLDDQRFPATDFDRIYMVDGTHSRDAIRLDLREE